MLDRISWLDDEVRTLLESDAVDLEHKQAADEKLREAGVDRTIIRIHQDEPFKRFLQQYISAEREAFAGGDREEPLCRCRYPECDLKQGRLPGRIRGAADLQSGIDDFQERHPDAIVLLEAREEWLDRLTDCRQTLREVYHDLQQARAEAGLRV